MCSLVITAPHQQEVNVRRTDSPKSTTTFSIKHSFQKKTSVAVNSYAIGRHQGRLTMRLSAKESLCQHLNQPLLYLKIKSKYPHLPSDLFRNMFHLSNELLLFKDQVPLIYRNGNFVFAIEMSIIRYPR